MIGRLMAMAAAFALLGATPAKAQIPVEWRAAAQAVIGAMEQGTPTAAKPWGSELSQGWSLARIELCFNARRRRWFGCRRRRQTRGITQKASTLKLFFHVA